MARPQFDFDWETIADLAIDEPLLGTRQRLRLVLALFAAALAIIFARAVQLEFSDGDNFRRLAAQPLERTVTPSANRGTILARDGTPLAVDRPALALAIEYHYLASPPDPEWLRRMARARLPRAERRRPERVAAMEQAIRDELADVHRRLAAMCKLPDAEWQARAGRIQRRVTALAAHVNARRLERFEERNSAEAASEELSVAAIAAGLFAPPERLPPPPVVLAEQTAYHPIVIDLAPQAAAAIERDPKAYPGAKVIEITHRAYPAGSLAAHWLGYLGSGVDPETAITAERDPASEIRSGVMGVERSMESVLRPHSGLDTEFTDRRGKLLTVTHHRPSLPGRDVVLSIDPQLQRSAETLLDRSARRLARKTDESGEAPHGGAIVVVDVHSGEILAAASAPRFDPNWFAAGDPRVEAVLHDPRQPLFDRVAKMAIPPGSVFKPFTAAALVENSVVDPREAFHCQGFLDEPDRLRCQIFRQQGIGHGDVTLADALAQSCNVYFFHHVTRLGAARLVDWAGRFGFGQPTGIDLPDEAAGQLPAWDQLRQTSQTQAMAIGQGALTATPLQVARAYAAIANGGYLITPRLSRASAEPATSRRSDAPAVAPSESTRIVGLSRSTLDAVREGLRRVVDDPSGTAFSSVRLRSVAIAGKTGTAETGSQQEDHAWFAGYAPADAPRYAFVVALEHAGSGAQVAGSLARLLVERMQQLGYFGPPEEPSIPPGKG